MSGSNPPILSRLTTLRKPQAGLPPREVPAQEGITQAPASREVNEALLQGDLDAELERDAKLKGLMPVIEQDETEAKRRRTGYIQQLANQEPSRVHGEEAVNHGKTQGAAKEPMMIRLSINPTLRRCQVESKEDVQATVVGIGAEVTVKLTW